MALSSVAVLAVSGLLVIIAVVALARARKVARAIFQSIGGVREDLKQLDYRLEALGSALGRQGSNADSRLEALGSARGQHASHTDSSLDALGSALGQHASDADRRLEAMGTALGQHASHADRRLEAMGSVLGLHARDTSGRLEALGTALGQQPATAALRLETLEAALGQHADDTSNRLEALGTALGQHASNAEGRLEALGTALGQQPAAADHRVAALESLVGRHADDTSNRLEALGTALGQHASNADSRLEALGSVLGLHANDTSNRLDELHSTARELGQQSRAMQERVNDIRAATAMTQAAVWADSLADFLAPFDWTAAIATATSGRPVPLAAEAFLQRRNSVSQPVDLRCADGHVYVVKGLRHGAQDQGRTLFTEHVVGHLGMLLGAPVPEIALVSITGDLIADHPDADEGMGHMFAGLAHGMRRIEGVDGHSHEIMHIDANRDRFAKLAILHTWTQATDRQFLYESQPPHRVHSTDHGHYFAGDRQWADADLRLAALTYPVDDIIEACGFSYAEIAAAVEPLRTITPQQIAHILAMSPESWGVGVEERAVVGRYLRLRQFHLLAMFGAMKGTREPKRFELAARSETAGPIRARIVSRRGQSGQNFG